MPADGVLNVYKEKGCTSFHVVSELRKITGIRSIGHTGTLDPDAEGVLVLCIGKATKISGVLTDTDKEYHAEMLLGRRTDTQDISGRVLEETDLGRPGAAPDKESLETAVLSFKGEISQIPPMYSALKVGGVKLVDAARRGENIERRPRKVTVYDIRNIKYDENSHTAAFDVRCSKGTYIRTLCEDIGKRLGIPACLKSLVRTKVAGFDINGSVSLSKIKQLADEGELSEYIIPTDHVLKEYDYLIVKDGALKKLMNGNVLFPGDFRTASSALPGLPAAADTPGIFRIYDGGGRFYALYTRAEGSDVYKCEKMFA